MKTCTGASIPEFKTKYIFNKRTVRVDGEKKKFELIVPTLKVFNKYEAMQMHPVVIYYDTETLKIPEGRSTSKIAVNSENGSIR